VSEIIKGKDKHGEYACFVDGKTKDPSTCPKSNRGTCPECNIKLDSGYGFAGGYGLGGYRYCPECGTIYDFCEDTE